MFAEKLICRPFQGTTTRVEFRWAVHNPDASYGLIFSEIKQGSDFPGHLAKRDTLSACIKPVFREMRDGYESE